MLVMKTDSSCIKGIAYKKGGIVVAFVNKKTYFYSGVEREVYNAFLMSDSKGRFYTSVLKGIYPSKKIKPMFIVAIGGTK